jgi:hypothetical protein
MCVRMYVCLFVCMYVRFSCFNYVCAYICMCLCVHIEWFCWSRMRLSCFTCVCIYVCIYVCAYVPTPEYQYNQFKHRKHTYIHTCISSLHDIHAYPLVFIILASSSPATATILESTSPRYVFHKYTYTTHTHTHAQKYTHTFQSS